jgi:hypothetical protein
MERKRGMQVATPAELGFSGVALGEEVRYEALGAKIREELEADRQKTRDAAREATADLNEPIEA